jgi:hypothetical protein
MPVFAPAATPTVDSIYAAAGAPPSRPEKIELSESAVSARPPLMMRPF